MSLSPRSIPVGYSGFGAGSNQMDVSAVSVTAAVQRLNQRVVGATAGDPQARHGSAEQGRPRRRSRDRSHDRSRQRSGSVRSAPVGRAEADDWLSALEAVYDRLDTLERQGRHHGQSIAHLTEQQETVAAKTMEIDQDIAAYKNHITSVHGNMATVFEEKLRQTTMQLDALTTVLPASMELLNTRVEALSAMVDELRSRQPVQPPGLPQEAVYIGTPVDAHGYARFGAAAVEPVTSAPVTAAPPTAVYVDQWAAEAERIRTAAGNPVQGVSPPPRHEMPHHVHPAGPNQGPMPFPAVPQSFAAYNQQTAPDSPFHGQACPAGYNTPPNHGGAAPHVGQPGGNGGQSAWANGKACFFDISRKLNPLLFIFTRNVSDFQLWRDRMLDHMCRSTPRWRHTLDYIAKSKVPVKKGWLLFNNVEGINAWDLATMVESFVVDWLPKSMYKRRIPLSGGEQGNGFELWRRLHHDYQGDIDVVEFGGVRRLQEFGRCTDLKLLDDHLDDWTDVLSTYGTELEHCPKLLRSMVLNIIPKEFEDELLTKPEFTKTYLDIIKWCKMKSGIKRTRELSDFTRKGVYGGPEPSKTHHAKAVRGRDAAAADEEEVPAEGSGQEAAQEIPLWAKPLMDQMPGLLAAVQARPKPKAARPKPKARPRAVIPAGFSFNGCWHCGATDHTRSGGRDGKGKKCPLFDKLLKDANPGVTNRRQMKLPAGYQGKYEKALIAAGGKPRRINRLEGSDTGDFTDEEESDFEDAVIPGLCRAVFHEESESDSDDDEFPDRCAMFMSCPKCDDVTPQQDEPPVIHHHGKPLIELEHAPVHFVAALRDDPNRNKYAALAESDSDHFTTDSLDVWNNWQQKVSRRNRKSKAQIQKVTVTTEAELDDLLKSNPKIATLPENHETIRRIMRQKPVELECEPGEVLCLVDSGSTVNAAWIEKHFPSYKAHVKQTKKSKSGDFATTACGRKIFNKGRCKIQSSAQDHAFPIAFKDMEVELPILSVRKIVKNANRVSFHDGGGSIKNKHSRKTIRFYEHEGVYFLKLKVHGPDDDLQSLDFIRPARQ